jgi:hypothetical protein
MWRLTAKSAINIFSLQGYLMNKELFNAIKVNPLNFFPNDLQQPHL